MFWTYNYVLSPHIEALLNKEDVTLQELMDEEDILQECKSQNKKLVDYLIRPEVMEELVTLTTKEPPVEVEERWRYKYANVACELLTCDVPMLNEKLAGNQTLLTKLYSFIDTDRPLNPLLASYFSKAIGVLVTRKSDQVLEFLKSRQRCVDLLLQHLETSAIMDLVLKLVTQIEGTDMRQNILNWLDDKQLVQRLVKLLSPASDVARHTNASQLLCDMVKAARENRITSTERPDLDPILDTLESTDTVILLLETILNENKLESSIVGGIQVLLALLNMKTNTIPNEGEVHGNGVEDAADHEQRTKIAIATIPYLEQLNKLLLDPPYKPAIKTTAGILECPLGNTRLHVAKLFVTLLSTENSQVLQKLVDLDTFQVLLDLFFKYSWNNFLHTQVEQCLTLAINYDGQDVNDIIYANIFMKCKLIDRILEAWDKDENKPTKNVKQGYMGHLINIANNIVTQCEKSNVLESFLKTNLSSECLNKWEALVTNQLAEINKTHQIYVDAQTKEFMNSEENLDEYNSYSHNAYTQQMYSGYQAQQMTSQFIESYGVHDDEFNDGDDAPHNTNGFKDEFPTMGFKFSEEDLDKGEDLFNKVCQQKQRAGIEESSGGCEWGDEGEHTFQTVIDKRDWPSKQQNHDSSSSDDDEDPHDLHMEVDSIGVWELSTNAPNNAVLPEVNPWDVAPAQPVEQTGWANFDNFDKSLNIETTPEVDNKPCDNVRHGSDDASASLTADKERSSHNESSTEIVGGGDMPKVETTTDAFLEVKKTNVNDQLNAENVGAPHTADSNANPSELVGNRKTGSTEAGLSSKELVTNIVENEKAPNNDNIKPIPENPPATSKSPK